MAYNFDIRFVPVELPLFEDGHKFKSYHLSMDKDTLQVLTRVLRHLLVLRYKQEPLTYLEEDILSDLYNSLSLFKIK